MASSSVIFEVDTSLGSISVADGTAFLGEICPISFTGWTPASTGNVLRLTVFDFDGKTPLADNSANAAQLDLRTNALRKRFADRSARSFLVFVSEYTALGEALPQVTAKGRLTVQWSPFVWDEASATFATLEGPPGEAGADGKDGKDGRDLTWDTMTAGQKSALVDLVAAVLAQNPTYAALLKGGPGPAGANGLEGAPGKAGKDGKDGMAGADGQDGKDGKDFAWGEMTEEQKAEMAAAVAAVLAQNPTYAALLKGAKGEPGLQGLQGIPGQRGEKGDTPTDYINNAAYDSDAKKILFYQGETVRAEVDASAFIKDGMVSSVAIVSGNLVITFNTDAGKDPVSIPLTDIFNPANYYDKTSADQKFVPQTRTINGKALSSDITLTASDVGAATLADTMRFSAQGSYAVGDVVFHNGAFYRCTTAHTANVWNASHFAEVIGGLSAGTPTAPTPTAGDDSTKVATTAFVQKEIPSWAKTTNKPSYTLNEVCPYSENWLGVPGTIAAGKSIKVLAKTVNGVIEGGLHVTGSSNNDNNITKYRYGGVTVTRNGVATDYLFDNSQSGIARLSNVRYDMPSSVALVADNDEATLVCADRAVTNATIADGFSTLNLTFPTAVTGKVRNFYLRITVAAGESAPALSIPQGITIENPDGAVPEIADGETSAASTTLVWFSETAPNIFTAKSETLKAVA